MIKTFLKHEFKAFWRSKNAGKSLAIRIVMALLILLLMWALGLGFGVAGNLIHILLVVALVVLIVNVLQGRRVA